MNSLIWMDTNSPSMSMESRNATTSCVFPERECHDEAEEVAMEIYSLLLRLISLMRLPRSSVSRFETFWVGAAVKNCRQSDSCFVLLQAQQNEKELGSVMRSSTSCLLMIIKSKIPFIFVSVNVKPPFHDLHTDCLQLYIMSCEFFQLMRAIIVKENSIITKVQYKLSWLPGFATASFNCTVFCRRTSFDVVLKFCQVALCKCFSFTMFRMIIDFYKKRNAVTPTKCIQNPPTQYVS
mmetsp:Transcript_17710/g.37207  ORF Transcript_17710/g.37207 Transcript_17710/m.37207 type:complete len:237 (-) Transcript_17710:1515-2225(-)